MDDTHAYDSTGRAHPVRVLDCDGWATLDSIVAGVDWSTGSGAFTVTNSGIGSFATWSTRTGAVVVGRPQGTPH